MRGIRSWRVPAATAALVALSTLSVALVAGCAKEPDEPPSRPAAGAVVRVSVLDSPQAESFLELHVPDWQVQSGGRVEMQEEAEGGADLYIAPLGELGRLAARFMLAELPADVYEPDPNAPRDWPEAVRDHLWYWGPTRCVVPLSVRTYVLAYCPDRLPRSLRERVEQISTWRELDELVAKLPGEGPGLLVPSITVAVLLRAATYARSPQSFAFLIEPWQGEVLVDAPPVVKAMSEWLGVRKQIAVGGASDLVAGKAPLAIVATDSVRPLLTEQTGITARFAPLPGSMDYYDHAAGQWRQVAGDEGPHRVAFFDGIVAIVPDGIDNIDAAQSLVRFLVSPETSLAGVVDPQVGLGPFRLSHFRRTGQWSAAGWDVTKLGSYFAAVQTTLANRVAVETLQVRNARELAGLLQEAVEELWQGKAESVGDRLKALHAAWREAIDRAGREHVVEDYRRSVGLVGIVSQ